MRRYCLAAPLLPEVQPRSPVERSTSCAQRSGHKFSRVSYIILKPQACCQVRALEAADAARRRDAQRAAERAQQKAAEKQRQERARRAADAKVQPDVSGLGFTQNTNQKKLAGARPPRRRRQGVA